MPLFHYTDLNAVHAILKNKKLWLTDIRYLNDTQELLDGIRCLGNALKTPMAGLFANHEYAHKAISYLREAIIDDNYLGSEPDPIFVFSLGRVENLLSQWRGYGNYAIEFDEQQLAECVSELHPCIYDQKSKSDASTVAVTKAITNISQSMGRNDGCIDAKGIDSLGALIKQAAEFKHEGFSEEQEVRVITSMGEGDERIKYRPKDNILIPYLELDITLDSIVAIHVGPMVNQDLAFASMSSFARSVERNWQIESSNIEYWLRVERSLIPYRE